MPRDTRGVGGSGGVLGFAPRRRTDQSSKREAPCVDEPRSGVPPGGEQTSRASAKRLASTSRGAACPPEANRPVEQARSALRRRAAQRRAPRRRTDQSSKREAPCVDEPRSGVPPG